MKIAKAGDKVRIRYKGFLDNGDVFDSTPEGQNFDLVIGEGKSLPTFEFNLIGMEVGSQKQFVLPPEFALGPKVENLVAEMDKNLIPAGIKISVGTLLEFPMPTEVPSGETAPPLELLPKIRVRIAEVKANTVALDGNHPLAGYNLNFFVELIDILRES